MEKDIPQAVEVNKPILTKEQENLIKLSKRMMSKYVEDNFAEKIDKEEITQIIDKIDVRFADASEDEGRTLCKDR